jgi:hypothetical protein
MVKSRLMAVKGLVLCAVLLASCGGGEAEGTVTPTFSADQIQTFAIETFSAALTDTALAAPSDTPVPTLTASPTFAPIATITGGTPVSNQPASASSASCYKLTFVSDVSVPDNTAMTQGQAFTKTWKVLNSGSCAWDAGFKFAFKSGEQMSGATYVLPSAIAPNATLDISVAMTAPAKTGTLRGDWQMSTAGGQFFGDIVYVQIVVGGGTASTAVTSTTGGATNTPATPSPTLGTTTVTAP